MFSNEIGEPLPHFHDTWLRTVLKAHGVTPTWTARLNFKGLSTETKAAFRRINLRWHDLRHEYASRLVERGVPLAQVRDLLGHASITTTERYDTQKLENLQVAVTKLERGMAFDAVTPGVGSLQADAERDSSARKKRSRAARSAPATAKIARTKFQESFKYERVTAPSRTVKEVTALEPNELEELNLGDWLGGRDSSAFALRASARSHFDHGFEPRAMSEASRSKPEDCLPVND